MVQSILIPMVSYFPPLHIHTTLDLKNGAINSYSNGFIFPTITYIHTTLDLKMVQSTLIPMVSYFLPLHIHTYYLVTFDGIHVCVCPHIVPSTRLFYFAFFSIFVLSSVSVHLLLLLVSFLWNPIQLTHISPPFYFQEPKFLMYLCWPIPSDQCLQHRRRWCSRVKHQI